MIKEKIVKINSNSYRVTVLDKEIEVRSLNNGILLAECDLTKNDYPYDYVSICKDIIKGLERKKQEDLQQKIFIDYFDEWNGIIE